MNRITEEDKKRATKALERCAAETKDIEDKEELNKKAYEILSEELGDKPELLKRACEGYNSAKSLYKFGIMGESRGDTFAILDAPKLAEMARKEASSDYVHKVASVNGFKKAQFTVVPETPVMNKAASDEESVRRHEWEGQAIPFHTMQKMSSVETVQEINSCTEDMASCLHKVARDREEALQVMHEAEERFFSAMATETPAMRKQAAEMLVNAYGDFGKLLVDMFNVNAGQQKIASYNPNKYKGSVRLPDTVLFKSASAVLEAHANRVTADYIQDTFVKDAVDYARDVFAAHKNMHKEAAATGGFTSTLAAMVSADKLSEKLSPEAGRKSEAELESEINTTELVNTLKQHSIKRAFMHTVTDPTVARYPLHQVTQAFNESLSELPIHMRDLPPTAFSALLKSRTIARLGRGGAASGSDVDQIQQIQQAFGRVRPKDISTFSQDFDQ